MFNLFQRLTSLDENDREYYSGRSIEFKDLIEIVRLPNSLVTTARDPGKGTEVYDTIKTKHLPCFFANAYNSSSTRSTKVFFKSSGYIYFDFASEEQATDFKESLIKNDYVSCMLVIPFKNGIVYAH